MPTHRSRSPLLGERAREMRRSPNDAESVIWQAVWNRKLRGFKFRRQYPLGNYVADFFCAEAKLILELDGKTHHGKEGYDSERQAWLELQGLMVLRFTNEDVKESLEALLERVCLACVERSGKSTRRPGPSP